MSLHTVTMHAVVIFVAFFFMSVAPAIVLCRHRPFDEPED